MIARFTKSQSNARNLNGEKELVNQLRLMTACAQTPELRTLIDARFWMGRSKNSSTVYCSIWVHAPNFETSGYGTAAGYGYHKESTALQGALSSAGIELYGSPYSGPEGDITKRSFISGCGSTSMTTAIEAIGLILSPDTTNYVTN